VAHVLGGWGKPRSSFEGLKVDVKEILGDRISDKKILIGKNEAKDENKGFK
jgi:hypothetical protein